MFHTRKTGLNVVDETLQESQEGFKRNAGSGQSPMVQRRIGLGGSRFSILLPAQGLSLHSASQRHLPPPPPCSK